MIHKASSMRNLGALDNFKYLCFLKDGQMEGLEKKAMFFVGVC